MPCLIWGCLLTRRPRRALAQGQAEVEALERRLAEAQDAEGRAQGDLRDAEQALADRWGQRSVAGTCVCAWSDWPVVSTRRYNP